MRGLRFAAGLAAVLLLHIAGVRLFDGFFRFADLFLVVALWSALGGGLLGGMAAGLVAGLITDTLTGGLYGMYGFADTIVGYGAAFAAQRLVIQRATAVWLVFSAGAVVQQALVIGLTGVLLPDPALPDFVPVAAKVALTGFLGVASHLAARRLSRTFRLWKKNRTARLR